MFRVDIEYANRNTLIMEYLSIFSFRTRRKMTCIKPAQNLTDL